MQIELTSPILDLDHKPLAEGLTIGQACIRSLLETLPGDEKTDGAAKLKLFMLAQRINGQESIELTAEETALIKDRSGRLFTAIAVGRVWQALDPASLR